MIFDARKTRMIALPYGEKNYDNMLSRFHTIPESNGRTDGQTDLLYQYRAIKKVIFSKTKQFRATVSIDDL